MTVLWIRHGTCEDGLVAPEAHARPDSPLTVRGANEAVGVADLVRRSCNEAVHVTSSPLARARRTAAIIADALDCTIVPADDVYAEWRAPDCVLGRTPDEYPPEYHHWRQRRLDTPTSALPGGESLQDFATRAGQAYETSLELEIGDRPTVIVAHRMLIGAVAALHRGITSPADVFRHAHAFTLAPGGLWEFQEERAI